MNIQERAITMAEKFSRVFDFKRGTVTITYDPDAANDECVYIDHSGPLSMTLDETHRFHSFFMDFLAIAREMPKRPTHSQMQEFVNRAQADPGDSPSTIP